MRRHLSVPSRDANGSEMKEGSWEKKVFRAGIF